MGAEVFAGLDGGSAASPSQLLESLGRSAPSYKVLSTNSKSGEFFFFSGDSRYLVKTVSAAEGELLFKMLPGYAGHMRDVPRSLIVRYAGLYRVELQDGQTSWITVMCSVFEPGRPIHLSYDLKGSLHGRKKKEKEKVGKDQDWVESGQCLNLLDDVRREFCAVQEQDAAFLMSYGVMDYSLLVGIHNLDEGAEVGMGWRSDGPGLWAVTGKHLYFAGMIDFLIAYDMKKQGEHIVRVLQDHGHDASCVDPVTYARRNVMFIREYVVMPPEDRKDNQIKTGHGHNGKKLLDTVGTLGTLKVTVFSANKLINADGILSKSDPYVTVGFGLLRSHTKTISNNLNPVWNETIYMPVDLNHESLDVTLRVWDEDVNRKLQGEDDPLGRTSIPLQRIIRDTTVDLKNQTLEDVKSGEITVRLEWEPRRPPETASLSISL